MTDTTAKQPPEQDPTADFRPSERYVLHVLREHGGDLPLTRVHAETGLPKRTARDAAERLEAAGYIERRKEVNKPRQYRWVLTD